MKKSLLFILLFFLLQISTSASTIPINVIKVYDGDTVRVKMSNGNKFSIRLYGVDCYETSRIHRAYTQAYQNNVDVEEIISKGKIAKNYLENISSKSKSAKFEFCGVDKYSRVLGILYLDNINVNEELLKKKLCFKYEYKE